MVRVSGMTRLTNLTRLSRTWGTWMVRVPSAVWIRRGRWPFAPAGGSVDALVAGPAEEGRDLVLDGALEDELGGEASHLAQAVGVSDPLEQDGVDLLDQPVADGYSADHGVPPSAVLIHRFGGYAVFNFSSSPGTSPAPERSTVDTAQGRRFR
jgi:hypothetical protein